MSKRAQQIFTLLIIAAMLLPVFAGCVTPDSDNSDTSVNISEAESEVQEDKGDPVTEPEFSTVISTGKPYTTSVEAGEKYPDSYGIELTDNITGPAGSAEYKDVNYVGYPGGTLTITLDLGKIHTKIYEVRMGYLSTTNAGIAPPSGVKIKISKDGRKYTDAGEMTIPEYVDGDRLEAVFTSEYYIRARYIRLEISKLNTWIFLDEISVISDEMKKQSPDEIFRDAVKAAYDNLGTVKYEGGETPDKELALQLVSKGCKYTLSAETASGFADNGKYLTDGNITGVYELGKWVGFDGGDAVAITVDLGEKREDMSEFRLTCYANNATKRYMPVAVTYAVSDNNTDFTDIGRIYGVYSGQSIYEFPLVLDKCASGRYVRFTLEATDTKKYIIEEAAVYANTGVIETGSFFDPLVFETETKKWEKISYETVNLIQGNIQQIFIPEHITGVSGDVSKPNSPVITDGKKATSNEIHNGQFFKFQSASAPIEIYYDLGDMAAVKSFTAQFTHRIPWGVQAPFKVAVFLSDDAKTWYNAGTMKVEPISDNTLVSASFEMKSAVQARYICFSLLSCGWLGISELEAFGTTATGGAPKLNNSGLKTREESVIGYKEPSKDLLNGAKDLCLLYHGPKLNGFDVKKLIPYLGYVDTDKNITDTMFDSFLFLNSGGFPSGNSPSQGYKESDIQWIVDDLFTEGKNILALEEAAGQVKSALSLDDSFKYGLTVALYMPPAELNLEDKIKSVEEQIILFEENYNKYNFKNIELIGYYWFDEGVYPKENEPELVMAVSDMVHEKGLDFIWIPWFCASGVDSWQDFGFDVACMQPGYVFKEEVLESRLEYAANMAKYYGMGIEIEIASATFNNANLYRRYLEYLAGGAKYGYLENCVHMYYQEIYCYYDAATAGGKMRLIYDYTYQFIKGTLSVHPEALEDVSVNGGKNEIIFGQIMTDVPAQYTFDIVSMPKRGTVSLANDGTFTYFPEKDFTGEVTFTYTYNTGFGESEICRAVIIVE
ncbi:MAG: DUF4855 domain-containing protein [Clostridia bacterium]|nr:DUF4855 domain-containing protein [Clostridia bacterium]